MEFTKRMDPDLPFYYHTSHGRFYEDSMPDFNQVPPKARQPRRAPRRELLGSNVGRRVTLAQRGASSLRATFHNHPIDLPPLSTGELLSSEHGYALHTP